MYIPFKTAPVSIMYIPFKTSASALTDSWAKLPLSSKSILASRNEPVSFTIQIDIDPKKVVKKFKQFKFNKYLNEFGFFDDSGVEYHVHCYRHGDDKVKLWGTVITLVDSLDPAKDVNAFAFYLYDVTRV